MTARRSDTPANAVTAMAERIAALPDATLADMTRRVVHLLGAGFLYANEHALYSTARDLMVAEVRGRIAGVLRAS